MDRKIAIYGGGGFGKEVRALIDDVNTSGDDQYSFVGFLDDFKKASPMAEPGKYDDVVIGIADGVARERIVKSLQGKKFDYRSVIHPSVPTRSSIVMGRGCIICAGVQMTVDISIGDFVIINLNATIGHDVSIGDFTSIMPSVNISGSVTIEPHVFIGTGAVILQGLTIGEGVTIGAGAVVTRSIPSGETVVGVPARRIPGK